MIAWLQKDSVTFASVLFRGTWACTKEGFLGLATKGIEISETDSAERSGWSMELKHQEWGEATLICTRDFPMPPHVLIDWDSDLIDSERVDIKACGNAISLTVNSRRKHLLRDRKNALLFLDAVMGEEGVAALDHVSQKFWSRAALKSEVAHSADADVQSLFSVHLVRGDDSPLNWLHTHGLARVGLVDFDILAPSESVTQPGADPIRAIAYAILEEKLKPGGEAEPFSGKPPLRAVFCGEFMQKTDAKWRRMRENDTDHSENRIVLCDPPARGLFSLFRPRFEPASVLRETLPDDVLIRFSKEATDLMSGRARTTYSFFRQVLEELAEYQLPCLIKIGYPVDGGEDDHHEHLWFKVHEARQAEAEATLLNQPFNIARMKEGDRGVHQIDCLSDWQVMTPFGPINPRQTRALRLFREAIARSKAKESDRR